MSRRVRNHGKSARLRKVVSSSFAIGWSFVLLIFLTFYGQYVAIYQYRKVDNVGEWKAYPILSKDFPAFLPILSVALSLSIVGHIVFIIFDKYLLRQSITIILNVFWIVTFLALLSIFPFDFSALPGATAATILRPAITVALIVIVVGLVIGTLVRLIKLIIALVK